MADADKERSKEVYHSLPLGKKIRYIFEYYKVILILIAAGVGILIYVIIQIRNPDPESVLSVALVEAATPLDDEGNVFSRFLEENGYDTEEETITVEVMDYSYYTSQLLVTRLLAGEIDLLAGDEDTIETLAESEGLLELEDVLPEELLAECGESLYYAGDADTGEEHVYAILLPESNALAEDGYYTGEVYIAIAYSAEHTEMAGNMIEYMLEADVQ